MSTYTPIASLTLAAATSSVTFANIPQTYTDLVLVVNCASDSGSQGNLGFYFNGDQTTFYSYTGVRGSRSNAASPRGTGLTYNGADYIAWPTTTVGETMHYIKIFNYSNTNTFKTSLTRANKGSTGVDIMVSLHRSTNPVSSITLGLLYPGTASMITGSTYTLYGISKIDAVTPKASGGDIVVSDGTYWYHGFTSTGTFTPSTAMNVDYLVVAGGGGAMGNIAGGGGAGGFRTATSQAVTKDLTYTVTVGAGGAGGSSDYTTVNATNGSNSSFNTFSSTGGGKGQYGAGTAGNGGSGGGARPGGTAGSGNAGSYSPSEGNNGAVASNSVFGGGGGGASAAGGVGTGTVGGAGGAGNYTAISGGSTTGFGQLSGGNYYFSGGGGGTRAFSVDTAERGPGGLGGGGYGAIDNERGQSGTTNTGGGGGGGGYANSPGPGGPGGNGGSGIVVVRYTV